MKHLVSLLAASFLVIVVLTAATVLYKKAPAKSIIIKQDVIGCSPAAGEEIFADGNGKFIPVLQGWGKHSYAISTNNDSAQFYFNQGLNLYYSYHPKQALASFKEAARFDKNCAMLYWGQALASGPSYNSQEYTMGKQVPDIIEKMNSSISNASTKESALIKAMQLRYAGNAANTYRSRLDSNYAAAMLLLTTQYPDDNDIKALYIDAVMLQHKWDFWHNNGQAKPWTPQLVKMCEDIQEKDRVHPGALHYYIHVTEASKQPNVALAGAEVLRDAMPGTSHMVHMASHMYQRNGMFAKGVYINEDANVASNKADSLTPLTGNGQNTILHYFAVQSYCAMTAGMYEKALPVYMRTRKRVVELNGPLADLNYMQFLYMMPTMAAVRLGKWQQILSAAQVNRNWKFAAVLDDFARGMAYVHSKDYKAAEECLGRIRLNLKDGRLAVRRMPFNKPVQSGRIAADILEGSLSMVQGNTRKAIAAFEKAVEEEDKLIYCEPHDWLIPARQYLGDALLQMKQPKEAEKVYREDLVWNPGNGWSLVGLYNSLVAQNKTKAAAQYRQAYLKAFEEADKIPNSSVY